MTEQEFKEQLEVVDKELKEVSDKRVELIDEWIRRQPIKCGDKVELTTNSDLTLIGFVAQVKFSDYYKKLQYKYFKAKKDGTPGLNVMDEFQVKSVKKLD